MNKVIVIIMFFCFNCLYSQLETLKSKQLIKNFYDDSWSDDKYRVTTNY